MKKTERIYRHRLLAWVRGDTEEKSCQKRKPVVKTTNLSSDVETFLFTQSLHAMEPVNLLIVKLVIII